MRSKARQSDFGGFFGLSLNLVVLPSFMWLRSSRGDDAHDVTSYRRGDNEHPALDKTDCVEAQLAGGIAIVELDEIGIQEHLRGRSEVDAVLLPVRLLLAASHWNSISNPAASYTGNQYCAQARPGTGRWYVPRDGQSP